MQGKLGQERPSPGEICMTDLHTRKSFNWNAYRNTFNQDYDINC